MPPLTLRAPRACSVASLGRHKQLVPPHAARRAQRAQRSAHALLGPAPPVVGRSVDDCGRVRKSRARVRVCAWVGGWVLHCERLEQAPQIKAHIRPPMLPSRYGQCDIKCCSVTCTRLHCSLQCNYFCSHQVVQPAAEPAPPTIPAAGHRLDDGISHRVICSLICPAQVRSHAQRA